MKTTTALILLPLCVAYTGFYLVDPETGEDEGVLEDGDSISGEVAIRAEFDVGNVNSVVFFINEELEHVENKDPWALFGNTQQNGFNVESLPAGETTKIQAIAYSEDNGQGTELDQIEVILNKSETDDDDSSGEDDVACIDRNEDCGFGSGTNCCQGESNAVLCWQKDENEARCRINCRDGWFCNVLSEEEGDDNDDPPADEPSDDVACIDRNEDCGFGLGTNCCQGESNAVLCWQKDENEARCRINCRDGWFCNVLDDEPPPDDDDDDEESVEPIGDYDYTKDLLVLHYDNAPDRDDVMSAALDRTALEGIGTNAVCGSKASTRLLAVQGTYGRCDTCNDDKYRSASEEPMAAILTGCTDEDGEAYLNAHEDWDEAVQAAKKKWVAILEDGNRVFVKEGGQSDFTADVLRAVKQELPDVDTKTRIFVVQHSSWNEGKTTQASLDYVLENTAYEKIPDANSYLKICGDNVENKNFIADFQEAGEAQPNGVGAAWEVAFDFYDQFYDTGKSCPYGSPILDASDTGELFYILGLGQVDLEEVVMLYF